MCIRGGGRGRKWGRRRETICCGDMVIVCVRRGRGGGRGRERGWEGGCIRGGGRVSVMVCDGV